VRLCKFSWNNCKHIGHISHPEVRRPYLRWPQIDGVPRICVNTIIRTLSTVHRLSWFISDPNALSSRVCTNHLYLKPHSCSRALAFMYADQPESSNLIIRCLSPHYLSIPRYSSSEPMSIHETCMSRIVEFKGFIPSRKSACSIRALICRDYLAYTVVNGSPIFFLVIVI
jgi:hypothetical protein